MVFSRVFNAALARVSGPRLGMQIIRLECGEELVLTHVVDALGQCVV